MLNKSITIKDILLIALLVIVAILLFKGCGNNLGGIFGTKVDTVKASSDTVFITQKNDTVYTPLPITVTNTIYKPYYKTDTLETYEVRIDPADTLAILARYYQKVFYSDTQLNKYGKIIIQDSVTQNRISSRRLQTDFKIPEVTNTITLKENRNVVYFGVGALGNKGILSVGGDLSIKTRSDNMYSAGAFISTNGNVLYQVGYKIPIRVKKRK